jgi:hypothetical protein
MVQDSMAVVGWCVVSAMAGEILREDMRQYFGIWSLGFVALTTRDKTTYLVPWDTTELERGASKKGEILREGMRHWEGRGPPKTEVIGIIKSR